MKRFLLAIGLVASAAFSHVALAESKSLRLGDDGVLNPSEALAPCAAAPANAYMTLCNRFNTEPGAVRCIAAGRNRHFDQCALNLCNRFNTENGAIGCLEASRDKRYQEEEMAFCNRFNTEQGATDCLRTSGEYIGGGGGGNEREFRRNVRYRAQDILQLIETGRYSEARYQAQDLLYYVDRNSR